MAEAHAGEPPRKRVKLGEPDQAIAGANDDDFDEQLQKELRVGITQFVSPDTPGFSGVLKQRYTDFLVNEISLDGQVLHLKSWTPPTPKGQKKPENKKPVEDIPPQSEPSKTEEAKEDVSKIENAKQDVPSNEDVEQGASSEEKAEPTAPENNAEAASSSTPTIISDNDQKELEELFGEPCVQAIFKLYEEVLKHPERKARDFRSISTWSIDDKERRGRAHGALRRIFNSNLASTHAEKNSIVITKALKGGRGADSSRWSRNDAGESRGKGKLGWDELGGEYLHFTMHKENKDTMEVISFMGSQLKCAPKSFQFAGTKDRRAVTVQRISLYRQQVSRLAGLNKLFKAGSKVGDFKYENYGLELGALAGNEFVVTLRDAHFAGEEGLPIAGRLELGRKIVGQAVDNLQEKGFMNYYGLQRFGTFAASTDEVGKKLLQGDYEGAVQLITQFHPKALEAARDDNTVLKISSDDRGRALALDIWARTGSAKEALEVMPRKFSTESSIIRHLGSERNGKKHRERDFIGALTSIQRNMRLMYVHAYQSRVWNTAAGKRWELHGAEVVEGDLVIVGDKSKGSVDEDEVDEDGEPIVRPAAEDSAAKDGDFTRARALRKEEAESGRYQLSDVVLPLPGWDVIYPANDVGKFYKEFMASDEGGNLDPYDMRRKHKDFSLSGGYRKIISKPLQPMSYEIRSYKDETENLVETDLDKLEKKMHGKNGSMRNGTIKQSELETTAENEYIAVILKLQLGSSQYATMALRELMKSGGVKNFKAEFTGRGM